MTSIVLFGSMGVAVECLEWLLTQPYDVRGVVCCRKPMSEWRVGAGDRNMADEAPRLGVPIYDLDDVPSGDLGLSVRFHQILRRRHLDRFRLGVVNLHGAPLPEMRGSLCDALAIAEGHRTFGASLHWMDEGIDSGDVLAVDRFPIENRDPRRLLAKTNAVGLSMIQRDLAAITSGRLRGAPQGPGMTYRRADVLDRLAMLERRAA